MNICCYRLQRAKNANVTTIMWYVPAIIDRTVLVNRPDAVMHDKTEETCLLIDVDKPDDTDGNTKECFLTLKNQEE